MCFGARAEDKERKGKGREKRRREERRGEERKGGERRGERRREEERRVEEIQREIDPKYEQNGEYQAREGGVLLKSCSCQDLSTSTNISFFLITSYLFSRL